MKFRPQRGSLAESMQAIVEIPPTIAALTEQLQHLPPGKIEVKPYLYDHRLSWDTHIVTLDGDGVGFTDGPIHD